MCVTIKQTAWLSRDYTVYSNPEQHTKGENCIRDNSWFFLNKSGDRGGKVCVELENFVRGKDPNNAKRGQLLWRADFTERPHFWQNVREPGSPAGDFPFALPHMIQWGGEADLGYTRLVKARRRTGGRYPQLKKTLICNFHMITHATLASDGSEIACSGVPILPRKAFGRDVCLRVQAFGTAVAKYYLQRYRHERDNGRSYYTYHMEMDMTEHVELTEFALLDRNDLSMNTAVVSDTGEPVVFVFCGDITDNTANYECPLFTVVQNGGFWSNYPPCVTTKPGCDPALAILIAHLMLKEYSTKEIKNDFRPLFPDAEEFRDSTDEPRRRQGGRSRRYRVKSGSKKMSDEDDDKDEDEDDDEDDNEDDAGDEEDDDEDDDEDDNEDDDGDDGSDGGSD